MANIEYTGNSVKSGFDNVFGFIDNISWLTGTTTKRSSGYLYSYFDETTIVHNGLTGAFQGLNGILYKRVVEVTYTYPSIVTGGYLGGYSVTGFQIYADGALVKSVKNIGIPPSEFNLYEGTSAFSNLIYGKKNTIKGSIYNDTLYTLGGGGDDLFGSVGDDVLIVSFSLSSAPSTLYGGPGEDIAVFGNRTSDYMDFVVSKSPSSNLTSIYWEDGRLLGIVAPDVEKLDLKNTDALEPRLLLSLSDQRYWGETTLEKPMSTDSVYRFFNTRDKAFFYTNSKDESNFILEKSKNSNSPSEWPYVFQGTTFESAHSYSGATPLYRFYNRDTGHHFFTVSKAEADAVLAKAASGEWPFNYEGTAFNVYANDPTPNTKGQEIAVHRFYSSQLNRHFYTASDTEVAEIKLTGQWAYEGIGFWGEI